MLPNTGGVRSNIYGYVFTIPIADQHTPIVLPQSRCTIEFLYNSHISEPALGLELHSRAAPSVEGITAQSIQPQAEIPEEGRTKKKLSESWSKYNTHKFNKQKICPVAAR